MLAESFAESAVNDAHVVLGRRLLPFAFWHAALLDSVRSPYLGHAAPGRPSLARLYTAVSLSRSVFPRVHRPVRSKWFAAWLQYRCGRFVEREHAAFMAYLADYISCPVFGEGPSDGEDEGRSGASKLPWYLMHVRLLRRHDHSLTEAAAWMTPVGYGVWSNTANAAAAGASLSNMLDDEDIAAFAEAGTPIG